MVDRTAGNRGNVGSESEPLREVGAIAIGEVNEIASGGRATKWAGLRTIGSTTIVGGANRVFREVRYGVDRIQFNTLGIPARQRAVENAGDDQGSGVSSCC